MGPAHRQHAGSYREGAAEPSCCRAELARLLFPPRAPTSRSGASSALQASIVSVRLEILVNHPAVMTHASVPKERRDLLGIAGNLVRLSVGVEDVEDLRAELQTALSV